MTGGCDPCRRQYCVVKVEDAVKIAIVGDWRWPQYEAAFARALRDNGHEVLEFSTSRFFNGTFGKYQYALPIPGPALIRLNLGLLRFVREEIRILF